MTLDRTEQLVRDVFTEEAGRAADSREVLAAVRGSRPRRSYGLVLATAAVVVVVAAVATFVVPEVFRRSSVPPAGETQTRAATPTHVLVVGLDQAELTDSVAIHGVPVCLRSATSDPLAGADFPAGEQTSTGPGHSRSSASATACRTATSTGSSGCGRSWSPCWSSWTANTCRR